MVMSHSKDRYIFNDGDENSRSSNPATYRDWLLMILLKLQILIPVWVMHPHYHPF